MRAAQLLLFAALAGCASSPSAPPQTLASLCSDYYGTVAGLTQAQRAKVDRAAALKVDADCNGSGSYGPKPRGSQMAEVRGATTKARALNKS